MSEKVLDLLARAGEALPALAFLQQGGPVLAILTGLSVLVTTLTLLKMFQFLQSGLGSIGFVRRVLRVRKTQGVEATRRLIKYWRHPTARVLLAATNALENLPENKAREEIERVATRELRRLSSHLRLIDLTSGLAPLLGLLGTVLGMIAAFHALEQAGGRADPIVLAGGIWEALMTTAFGLALAIPASAVVQWFDSVIDQVRVGMEDAVTRLINTPPHDPSTASGDGTDAI